MKDFDTFTKFPLRCGPSGLLKVAQSEIIAQCGHISCDRGFESQAAHVGFLSWFNYLIWSNVLFVDWIFNELLTWTENKQNLSAKVGQIF